MVIIPRMIPQIWMYEGTCSSKADREPHGALTWYRAMSQRLQHAQGGRRKPTPDSWLTINSRPSNKLRDCGRHWQGEMRNQARSTNKTLKGACLRKPDAGTERQAGGTRLRQGLAAGLVLLPARRVLLGQERPDVTDTAHHNGWLNRDASHVLRKGGTLTEQARDDSAVRMQLYMRTECMPTDYAWVGRWQQLQLAAQTPCTPADSVLTEGRTDPLRTLLLGTQNPGTEGASSSRVHHAGANK